ncbi:MAG TPA: ABC transporter substrate-binding protein [Chloroflexota bacterium]|nr:ABC transporter substrate-binding protein [Chloroflexota bacterium]
MATTQCGQTTSTRAPKYSTPRREADARPRWRAPGRDARARGQRRGRLALPSLLPLVVAVVLAAACAPTAGPASAPRVGTEAPRADPPAGGAGTSAAPPVAAPPAAPAPLAPAPAAAPTAPEHADAITLGYPAPSLSWFPALLADRKGFFAAEGLAPTFVQMVPTNLVAGLLSGDVDFSLDMTSPGQAAVQQGAPLRALMAFAVRPQHRLMVRAGIDTFADLRGQVVGINQHLDFTDWETRVVLQRNGVQPDEVSLLPIPSSPSRLAGLDAGQLAGAILATPFDLKAEAAGHHELGRISREIDVAWIGLAAAQRTLDERHDLVVRTLRAGLRGLAYARANRDESVQLLQDWLTLEPEVAAASYALGLDTWSTDGTASDTAWLAMTDIARLAAPLPDNLKVEDFVAKGPLDEARRQLAAGR